MTSRTWQALRRHTGGEADRAKTPDLDRATLSCTVLEWTLPSAEWRFVIDSNRIITWQFEPFTPLEELRAALKRM